MKSTRPTVAIATSAGFSVMGNSAEVIFPLAIVGPSRTPATISPSTGGWPIRLAAMPSSRASTMISARSNSSSWMSCSVIRALPAHCVRGRSLSWSPAAVRFIAESSPAQVHLAPGGENQRDLGHEHGVRGLLGQPDLGSVGRAEVGDENSPAVQVHPGVHPGHDPRVVGDAQPPGLARCDFRVQGRLAADNVVVVEL